MAEPAGRSASDEEDQEEEEEEEEEKKEDEEDEEDERRYDGDTPFTRDEFFEHYGNFDLWDVAEPLSPPLRRPCRDDEAFQSETKFERTQISVRQRAEEK